MSIRNNHIAAYNLKREKFNLKIDWNPCGLEPLPYEFSRLKI